MTVYHAQGGYLPASETHVTPLPDIYQTVATELGLDTVDVNGEDMLGKYLPGMGLLVFLNFKQIRFDIFQLR